MTTRLFNIVQSDLIEKGLNEFVDKEGNLVYFNNDYQFMAKILKYDDDVADIVNELFSEQSLNNPDFDKHFKKAFLYRFINRRINRQTIEAFRLELLSTFLVNEDYINRLYEDLDKYLTQANESNSKNNQNGKQTNTGANTSDNRTAYAELPQNNVQIDVNSTIMDSATDNTITRNKQTNTLETTNEAADESNSESKAYQLSELFKTNGLLEEVLNLFDVKCFMQTW